MTIHMLQTPNLVTIVCDHQIDYLNTPNLIRETGYDVRSNLHLTEHPVIRFRRLFFFKFRANNALLKLT